MLQYEVAIRKRAWYRVASEGGSLTFAEALRSAWMDPTTKERHFATPTNLPSVLAIFGRVVAERVTIEKVCELYLPFRNVNVNNALGVSSSVGGSAVRPKPISI